MCCLVPDAECFADITHVDPIGTCNNILAFKWLKFIIITIMVLAFIANSGCFVSWVYDGKTEWKSKHVLGCCLNAADFLMSVYIGIIVAADSIYNNNVGYIALAWKRSITCLLASAMCLYSIQMSILITVLIAVDRFICIVVNPFRKKSFTYQISIILALTVWIVALLAIILAFLIATPDITNSACIAIGTSLSLKYSILLLCLNATVFSLLCILYVMLLCTVVKSNRINKSTSNMSKIIFKLGVVLFSNFAVCFIISIFSIMSLSNFSFFPSLETLVGILFFPVNSLMNPLIYWPNTSQARHLLVEIVALLHNILVAIMQYGKRTIKRYINKR